MSVPSNQQKQLIENYFNLLVKEFITDPRHNKNISIVFTDHLESSKKNTITLGLTRQSEGGRKVHTTTNWAEWLNGQKVPGSERTVVTGITYTPYKYVISFLNKYDNEDQLRGTVVHEFTHLYLFATIGSHDHDSRFYSTMEWLEDWLNKNQGLSPRVDKSHDRDQYEDSHSSESTKDEKKDCPECSYPSPYHSPQCPQNQNKPHPTNQSRPGQELDIDNESQKMIEFDRLKKLLENSQDLTTLETVFSDIKSSPFYQEENWANSKKTLDIIYETKKYWLLNPSNSNQNFSTNVSDPSNKNELGRREYFLIMLTVVGIIFIALIIILLISEDQTKPKKRGKFRS